MKALGSQCLGKSERDLRLQRGHELVLSSPFQWLLGALSFMRNRLW